MKTFAPLILVALSFGCAHDPVEPPAPIAHASQAQSHFPSSAPIALAQKNYTNGLVSEAFAGLQSAYQEIPDLKYLEYSAELADEEIQWLKSGEKEKTIQLQNVNNVLRTFSANEKVKVNVPEAAIESVLSLMPAIPSSLIGGYSYVKARSARFGLQKEKAEYVYKALRDDQIEKYSKETFIPRMDLTKNAMLKIQPLLSSLITVPSPDYDRVLRLKRKIQKQREIICDLRIKYTSDIFIGPRVNLGDKLVIMARCDRPNIAGMSPGSLNTYWVNKLSTLFTKDYGDWIAESDEETRLKFKDLANNTKNALGNSGFADFQTTLDLLSNNKKNGNDLWWPIDRATD